MKGVKILLWIIVIIVALIAVVYYTAKLVVSKIGYNFSLNKLSFESINIGDFISTGQLVLGVGVNVSVINNNLFNISFEELEIWFYTNNKLIAKSKVPTGKVILRKGQVTTFVETLDFFINPNTIQTVGLIKLGKQVKIDYCTKLKVLGFELKTEDYFIINE